MGRDCTVILSVENLQQVSEAHLLCQALLLLLNAERHKEEHRERQIFKVRN